jgi:hypothetical protein
MKLRTTIQTLFAAFVLILLPASASALAGPAGPSIYFTQSSASVGKGDSLSLALHLNANGTPINSIDIKIAFPTDQLTFSGLDKAGSYFDTIIPATPTATAGAVEFSAASLAAGSTTSDVLIGNVSFTGKTDSGSAKVSLDGSAAANAGKKVDVTTSDTTVSLGASSGTPANTVSISGITVTNITLAGSVVQWKTAVAASGTVDYGTDRNYGFTASSADLSTDHKVDLGTKFVARDIVHYRITSVDAAGNRQVSADQTFTTLGYTVRITVLNTHKKPVSDASVVVGDSSTPAVQTSKDGVATITNVAAGSQRVTIDDKATHITVKRTASPTDIQPFTLVTTTKSSAGLFVGIIIVVLVLAGLGSVLYKKPAPKK